NLAGDLGYEVLRITLCFLDFKSECPTGIGWIPQEFFKRVTHLVLDPFFDPLCMRASRICLVITTRLKVLRSYISFCLVCDEALAQTRVIILCRPRENKKIKQPAERDRHGRDPH